MARHLRLATRGSPLARWQAESVAAMLRGAHAGLNVALVTVSTSGDRRADVAVWEMGGQGVFVKEVQAAVLEGRADAAVHSAKDLPSAPGASPGMVIAAVPPRGDPRDALVGGSLATLPAGALVATGSLRRRAQLAWLRPDLTFSGLRGNIATRLGRVPAGGAIVVAAAALERLGRAGEASELLRTDLVVPQVAQGAIAVECRASDGAMKELLAAIDDPAASIQVAAERAFLARLGGGCDMPVGAHASSGDGGSLRMDGLLASADGRVLLRERITIPPGSSPESAGAALAEVLLEGGGQDLLRGGRVGSARQPAA